MPDFLIDANLPAKISIWQNQRFIHVNTLDPYWNEVELLLINHTLINIYSDSIEAIK